MIILIITYIQDPKPQYATVLRSPLKNKIIIKELVKKPNKAAMIVVVDSFIVLSPTSVN